MFGPWANCEVPPQSCPPPPLPEPVVPRLRRALREKYSTSRHTLGLYQGVVNACQYVVPAKLVVARPLSEVVEEALARVVLALPALQVGIADEATNDPYFVQVPAVDLSRQIDWRTMSKAKARTMMMSSCASSNGARANSGRSHHAPAMATNCRPGAPAGERDNHSRHDLLLPPRHSRREERLRLPRPSIGAN